MRARGHKGDGRACRQPEGKPERIVECARLEFGFSLPDPVMDGRCLFSGHPGFRVDGEFRLGRVRRNSTSEEQTVAAVVTGRRARRYGTLALCDMAPTTTTTRVLCPSKRDYYCW